MSAAEAGKREALQRQKQTHAQAAGALESRMRAEHQKLVTDAELAKVDSASVIADLQSKLKTMELKKQLRDLEQAVTIETSTGGLLEGHISKNNM